MHDFRPAKKDKLKEEDGFLGHRMISESRQQRFNPM